MLKINLYINCFSVYLSLMLSYDLYGQWVPVKDFPGAGTDGCFSASIDGKGYVGGGIGRNTMYSYDPSSNVWIRKADVPGPSQRAWSGSFVAGNNLYILGGDSSFGGLLSDMWMYEHIDDKWSRKADFPGGIRDGMICWAVTINLKTRVYVGGGFNGQVIMNDFYEYEPVTDTWKLLPDNLPSAMLFASTFVINEKCYATFWEGGGGPFIGYFNVLWEFDPSANVWTEKSPCPGIERGEGIGFSVNGKGYAGLGQTHFNKGYTDLYEYDPDTDKWTELQDTFPHLSSAWSTSFVIGNTVFAGTGTSLPDFNFSNKFYKHIIASSHIQAEEKENDICFFPNPASHRLFFHADRHFSEIRIFDNTGRMVMVAIPDASDQTIDISSLQNGVYVVRTDGNNYQKLTVY